MLGTVDSTSVTVSWEAVADADRYTVTFTRATEDDQQGVCPGGTHSASVLVDVPSTTASIDIGQNVEKDVSNMLRAYSTYFVTVVAMNGGGSSAESEQILVLTPQIGSRNMSYVSLLMLSLYVQVQQYLLTVSWPQLTAPLKYLFNGTLLGIHVELGMATSLVTEYSTQHSLMVWYRLTRLKV